jgi:hypothetical protein
MSIVTNRFGQPVGAPLPDRTPRQLPSRAPMQGRLCRLEFLDAARHARAPHEACAADSEGRNWTCLPYGPFVSADEYESAVAEMQRLGHTIFYAIVDEATQRPVGVASYLRIDPANGSIEVGTSRSRPRRSAGPPPPRRCT